MNARERARNPYFIVIIFTRAMLRDAARACAVSDVRDASE
jgi:hypothetical protein